MLSAARTSTLRRVSDVQRLRDRLDVYLGIR